MPHLPFQCQTIKEEINGLPSDILYSRKHCFTKRYDDIYISVMNRSKSVCLSCDLHENMQIVVQQELLLLNPGAVTFGGFSCSICVCLCFEGSEHGGPPESSFCRLLA